MAIIRGMVTLSHSDAASQSTPTPGETRLPDYWPEQLADYLTHDCRKRETVFGPVGGPRLLVCETCGAKRPEDDATFGEQMNARYRHLKSARLI